MAGMRREAFEALMVGEIPLAGAFGMSIERYDEGRVVLRLRHDPLVTRPGATVNGPSMLAAADVAMYGAVLSLDEKAVGAVTSSLAANFLRAPRDADILAESEVIRHGRRLVYLQAFLYSEGTKEPVAHVTGTYAKRDAG